MNEWNWDAITRNGLAFLGALAFFGIAYMMFFSTTVQFPQEIRDMLNIVLGALIANLKEIYGFYFGSSQGSKDKTDAILHKE